MKTVFALAVVALVASSLAAGQDEDFKTLRDKLFAKDAQVLDKQQVIELLKKIQPLALTASSDDITKNDIDSLLKASIQSEDLCSNYGLFTETFRNLDSRKPEWNQNIKNYINTCEREQFAICLAEFKEDVSKFPMDDIKIIDDIRGNRLDGDYSRQPTLDIVMSALSEKLPRKTIFNAVGLKAKVEIEMRDSFRELVKSCDKLRDLSKTHSGVIYNVCYRDDDNLILDEETKVWANRAKFCDSIHNYASPTVIKENGKFRYLEEPIYPEIKEKVLSRY